MLRASVLTTAVKLYMKRCKLTKERATELYRVLNNHQMELEQQGMDHWMLRKTIKEEKAVADAEIEEYQSQQWRAYETSNREHEKCERYCREQRDLLRALEDLTTHERAMYELDNRKDQMMTVFKVATFQSRDVDPRSLFPEELCSCDLGAAGSLFPPARSGRSRTADGVRRTASL